MDWTPLIAGGFFVEILTELFKKWFNLKGGWVLAFAILFGMFYSVLSPQQTLPSQLNWNLPEINNIIINGVIISSFSKFYNYVFKFTRLKDKE